MTTKAKQTKYQGNESYSFKYKFLISSTFTFPCTSYKLSSSISQQTKLGWFHHLCQGYACISSISQLMNFTETDEAPEQVHIEWGTWQLFWFDFSFPQTYLPPFLKKYGFLPPNRIFLLVNCLNAKIPCIKSSMSRKEPKCNHSTSPFQSDVPQKKAGMCCSFLVPGVFINPTQSNTNLTLLVLEVQAVHGKSQNHP